LRHVAAFVLLAAAAPAEVVAFEICGVYFHMIVDICDGISNSRWAPNCRGRFRTCPCSARRSITSNCESVTPNFKILQGTVPSAGPLQRTISMNGSKKSRICKKVCFILPFA
jgi:hypothetical protein